VLAREPHNILARAIVSSPLTQDLASLAEAPRPRRGSAAVP
jgi:hypothetical protein